MLGETLPLGGWQPPEPKGRGPGAVRGCRPEREAQDGGL